MTKRTMNPLDGCSLEVDAQPAGDDRLRLFYTFTNGHAERNAYLFNRLAHAFAKGVFQTDPELVYVALEDKLVIVSKKIFPVPAIMNVAYRVVPCTSRVPPAGKLQEALDLPLPLRLKAPYPMGAGDRLAPDAPPKRALSFELGYFLAHPDGDKLAKEVQTLQGPAPRFDPFPETRQSVLRVDLGLIVPVALR